jgi:hypothetical protein
MARTWADVTGVRSGTVLTHTLLVPMEQALERDWLPEFWSLLRKPSGITDGDAYRGPLQMPIDSREPWEPVSSNDPFAAIAALLFSRTERPVALVDPSSHEAMIAQLWRALWRSARARFAACTFALGIRSTERGPFDVLVVPPTARASMADFVHSGFLLEPLRSPIPEILGVHDQAWFARLLAEAPVWRDELEDWCRKHGVTMPAASAVARLERLRTFDASASQRITAARGRLDTLAAVWPTLPGDHPYLCESIRTLIRHQHAASELSSPLRSLVDLVQRPEVERAAIANRDIDRMVVAAVRDEVAERIHRQPDGVLAELPSLYSAARTSPWRAAIVAGAADAVVQESRADERLRWIDLAIRAASPHLRVALGSELLKALPPSERVDLLEMCAAALDDRHRRILARVAIGVASRSHDTPLTIRAYELRGQRAKGLKRALELILAEEGPSSRALERIESLPVESRIDWSLGFVPTGWRGFAVTHGARWLRESRADASTVVARCAGIEHGPEVLLSWLDGASDSEVKSALADDDPVKRLVLHTLANPDPELIRGRGFDAVARRASAAIPDSDVQRALIQDRASAAADRVMSAIAPLLVQDVIAGAPNPVLAQLYSAPSWSRWLARSSPRDIRELVGREALSHALPQAWSITVLAASATASVVVVASIREADAAALDAAHSVAAQWFNRSEAEGIRERLAAEVLVAVRERLPKSGPVWIELCFGVVYPPVFSGKRDPFSSTLWRPGHKEWDVARNWREWLVQTWMDKKWPPETFLRTLKHDRRLLDDCCTAIRYRFGRLEFVESLLSAARRDDLLNEWREPLRYWYDDFKPLWRS